MAWRVPWWGLVVVVLLLRAGPAFAADERNADAINAAIGDASWLARYGTTPGPSDSERDRIRVHLEYVEARLRVADAGDLGEARRVARGRALDALMRYREAGEFPRRTADPYPGRRPRFIDDRGVHCAVGAMIAGTGHAALAEAINDAHQYDAIADIDTPGLRRWVDAHGLTEAELAMVQPKYMPVPTRDGAGDNLEILAPSATLECARRHRPPRRVTVVARGDREGNVKHSTPSRNPFARCFADYFGFARGGGAYEGVVRRFQVRRRIEIEAPQELLARRLQKIRFGGVGLCAHRPGPLPQEVRIDVSVGEAGLDVAASTSPTNAEVDACLADGVARLLTEFGPGRWRLAASVSRPFERRLSDDALHGRLRNDLGAAATQCWEHGAPARLSAKIKADPTTQSFDIDLTGGDDDFQACAVEQLDQMLREGLGTTVSRQDGTREALFVIDAAASAEYATDVESPAQRDERLRREADALRP